MRGTVAKRIRREVYGKDMSPRVRLHRWEPPKGAGRTTGRRITAGEWRRLYQARKRAHTEGRR